MISAVNGSAMNHVTWMACDYFDITLYSDITILTADTITANSTIGLAFYDINKKYISGIVHTTKSGKYSVIVRELEVPENAVYIRTTWYSHNHPNYEDSFGSFYAYAKIEAYEDLLEHSFINGKCENCGAENLT